MLSISAKCKYGIKAVLALGEHYGRGLIQIKEIAQQKQIPRQYLEQIFNRLVNAGIVNSVRGKKGGYKLAKDPNNLTILELIEVLEGGIQLTNGTEREVDAIYNLFEKMEKQLKKDMEITLAELIVEQQKLQETVMYHI